MKRSSANEVTARAYESPRIPVGMLVLMLLMLPLAAMVIFAFKGGPGAFLAALKAPDAQFAMRFSLLIAFATAAVTPCSVPSRPTS